MAALGNFRPQQAGPRTQALRQPARRRRRPGAAHGARRLYPPPGRREHLGRESAITASNPDEKGELFDPAADKIYRHPTFYEIPEEVGHM
jgi:hypothetical protein